MALPRGTSAPDSLRRTQPADFAPIAAFAGLLAVTCSVMIYATTCRNFWNASCSFAKFFGTTLLLGTVTVLLFATISGHFRLRRQEQRAPAFAESIGEFARTQASESADAAGALSTQSNFTLAFALARIALAKLAFKRRIFLELVDGETSAPTPLNKIARLLALGPRTNSILCL